MRKTKESQYHIHLDHKDRAGFLRFGLMANTSWSADPKRLVYSLSRYKFVSKMFAGYDRVLEVGCGDGFAARLVRREVNHLTAVDFDPLFIDDAKDTADPEWPVEFFVHDLLEGPVPGAFNGAYLLDVFEHIDPKVERRFLENLCASVSATAPVIIGIPSLQSQEYASPGSRAGHVNCKDMPDFKALLLEYFDNVFVFSMNDEVVHTGFHPMAHYLLALCVGARPAKA